MKRWREGQTHRWTDNQPDEQTNGQNEKHMNRWTGKADFKCLSAKPGFQKKVFNSM